MFLSVNIFFWRVGKNGKSVFGRKEKKGIC